MSATVMPLRVDGRSLTREERALVRGVPGLAERTVYDVARRFGGDPRDPDRVMSAHLGILRAAQTYDPEVGPFSTWAYYCASSTILSTDRKERQQKKLLTAGIVAGFRRLAERQHRVAESLADVTDEAQFAELVEIAQEQLVAKFLGVLSASERPEDDQDAAEWIAWKQVVAALLQVLDSFEPEERELLLRYAHGHTVKSIAEERRANYWSLRNEFERLFTLCRKRLAGLQSEASTSAPGPVARSALPNPEAKDPVS